MLILRPPKNPARPLPCLAAIAALLLLAGCATPPVTHGIPNLCQVAPGIYCGGQPTPQGWEYLARELQLTDDIVLNDSTDDTARQLGMTLHRYPISPWQQQFGPVGPQLESALQQISPGTYIHCIHGANRTRTLIILYRLRVDHWTKAEAITEANHYGWGTSLPALKSYIASQPEPAPRTTQHALASIPSLPSVPFCQPTNTYFLAVTATDTQGQESDYSAEVEYDTPDDYALVICDWNPVQWLNPIACYKIYTGSACRTYTSTNDAGTNLTLTFWLPEPPLTNHAITVTTTGATNLQSAPSLLGPWSLLGATNWAATNPPAPLYFRALGNPAAPARVFITSTAF